MSGICGLFNLDGAPVGEADILAMIALLKRRGPHGDATWTGRSIALAHTLLATTPESRHEALPRQHAESGCAITGDVRIDNRNELVRATAQLGSSEETGDAELVLHSYLKWGDDCARRLVGDFAFAIWDPGARKLFAARDHFGMRPFYYHYAPGMSFVFASEPRAILVLEQVPYRLNEGRIADFLVPELEWINYTSTFFEEIFRLPPAHMLTVTPNAFSVSEYCPGEPGPELSFSTDEEYREGFLEVFTQAIESRLRAPQGQVGAMLSGGMDSGSVVAVAKELHRARHRTSLPTYSAVRNPQETPDSCIESKAIFAATTMPSLRPDFVYPDDATSDTEQPSNVGLDEPFDGVFAFLEAIYRKATSQGICVVLDGGGGDVVLSEGSYIARLIRNGELRQAFVEISAENKYWLEGSLLSSLLRYFRASLIPDNVKNAMRGIKRRMDYKAILRSSLISEQFASQVDLAARFGTMRETFRSDQSVEFATERARAVRPNVCAGRERYARIAAAAGVEARDPFLDRRMVDYCSQLPGRFRLRDGWPKVILRDTMKPVLPKEVLEARGKPHLGWLFNAAMVDRAVHRNEIDEAALANRLQDYVDSESLADAWRAYRTGEDAETLQRAYLLARWLDYSARRPVVPV